MGYVLSRKVLRKNVFTIVCVAYSLILPAIVSAFMENYPPFVFKEGAPSPIKAISLMETGKSQFSHGSSISIKAFRTIGEVDFVIKDGDIELLNLQGNPEWYPFAVYLADLDKNGFEDLIVLSHCHGCDLAAYSNYVHIFLKMSKDTYRKIEYETMNADIADFVDMDKDGRAEVIITGLCDSETHGVHSYFFYTIYKIENGMLTPASRKFKGFPKFIWFTDNPNDKDTHHLTSQEKASFVARQYKSICGNSIDVIRK